MGRIMGIIVFASICPMMSCLGQHAITQEVCFRFWWRTWETAQRQRRAGGCHLEMLWAGWDLRKACACGHYDEHPEVTGEMVACPGQFSLLLFIIAGGLTISEIRVTGKDILPIPHGQSSLFRHEPLVGPRQGKARIGCASNLPAEESALAAAGRI